MKAKWIGSNDHGLTNNKVYDVRKTCNCEYHAGFSESYPDAFFYLTNDLGQCVGQYTKHFYVEGTEEPKPVQVKVELNSDPCDPYVKHNLSLIAKGIEKGPGIDPLPPKPIVTNSLDIDPTDLLADDV